MKRASRMDKETQRKKEVNAYIAFNRQSTEKLRDKKPYKIELQMSQNNESIKPPNAASPVSIPHVSASPAD